MSYNFEISSDDLDPEKSEYSPIMKKLLENKTFKRVLDKYSERDMFYAALKKNLGSAFLNEENFKIAFKKTLGEFLENKNDSIVTEDVEKLGKEFFGDESYSKRFILPK